jgi:hypothetical protein
MGRGGHSADFVARVIFALPGQICVDFAAADRADRKDPVTTARSPSAVRHASWTGLDPTRSVDQDDAFVTFVRIVPVKMPMIDVRASRIGRAVHHLE